MNIEPLRRASGVEPDLPERLLVELAEAHDTPGRHYHTLTHVKEVAAMYELVAADQGWLQPREVWLAVLFHDVVYAVGRKDNEVLSAEAAAAAIGRWSLDVDSDRVAQLILWTAEHGTLTAEAVDRDAARFLDCDMAILGASPEKFARYEAQIAAEWTPLVGAAAYQQGRRAFVTSLLEADRIFLSAWFADRYESPAMRNLTDLRRALGD